MPSYEEIFTPECLNEVFPPERTDQFFEALFGACDIRKRKKVEQSSCRACGSFREKS